MSKHVLTITCGYLELLLSWEENIILCYLADKINFSPHIRASVLISYQKLRPPMTVFLQSWSLTVGNTMKAAVIDGQGRGWQKFETCSQSQGQVRWVRADFWLGTDFGLRSAGIFGQGRDHRQPHRPQPQPGGP